MDSKSTFCNFLNFFKLKVKKRKKKTFPMAASCYPSWLQPLSLSKAIKGIPGEVSDATSTLTPNSEMQVLGLSHQFSKWELLNSSIMCFNIRAPKHLHSAPASQIPVLYRLHITQREKARHSKGTHVVSSSSERLTKCRPSLSGHPLFLSIRHLHIFPIWDTSASSGKYPLLALTTWFSQGCYVCMGFQHLYRHQHGGETTPHKRSVDSPTPGGKLQQSATQ